MGEITETDKKVIVLCVPVFVSNVKIVILLVSHN